MNFKEVMLNSIDQLKDKFKDKTRTYQKVEVDDEYLRSYTGDYTWNENKAETTDILDDLKIRKVQLPASVVLNVLAKYNAKDYYGVIVNIKDRLYNPCHSFKVFDFIREVQSCENDELVEVVFFEHDESIKSDKIDDYVAEIKQNLCYYLAGKKEVKIIEHVDLKKNEEYLVECLLKGNFFIEEKEIMENDLQENEEIILPIDLATYNITYPYYGLLGVKDYNRIANLSQNYLSGNVKQHTNKSYEIYFEKSWYDEADEITRYDEEYVCMDDLVENYNTDLDIIEDSINGLNNIDAQYFAEDIFRNADDEEIEMAEIRETDYPYNAILYDGKTYATQVCYGDNKEALMNIHVLSNMNAENMYFRNTLRFHYVEEAIAHQLITQEIIKETLGVKDENNN